MTEKEREGLMENDGAVVVGPGTCEDSGYVIREENGKKVRAYAGGQTASRRIRTEPSLMLPAVTDRRAADDRLKALIDDWILPRLVDEFLREHAVGQELPGREKT
jgi:hypothetical protein